MKRRGELRMIERAIRQGWKTPPEEQERSINLALETLEDETASEREQAAACRVLTALVESSPAKIRKRAQDALRYHEQKRIEQ